MGLVLVNTNYFPPKYRNENGRMVTETKDLLVATILNEETGERKLELIPEPEICFYVVKDFDKYTYPQISIPKEEVFEVRCKYSKRKFELAKAIGLEKEYLAMRSQGLDRFREWYRQNIQNSPYLYQADIDIEDFYRFNFSKTHPRTSNTAIKIRKAFADIEVDQKDVEGTTANGDNPIAPVNCIQYFDSPTMTMYAFVLTKGLEDNPDFIDVRNNTQKFIEEFLSDDDFDEDIHYNIWFYNTEEDLFLSFWNIVNKTEPDFCGIWNIAFDIPYLWRRAHMLNMDVADMVCHPSVPQEMKRVNYQADSQRFSKAGETFTKAKKHFALMWDWPSISGYTQFYDQMSLYANQRKRTMEPSYKLDDISYKELKFRKVSLTGKNLNIRTAAYDDFKTFLQYAIKDTYILYKLEKKVEDLEKYMMTAGITQLEKGVSISYVLKNLLMQLFDREDRIIGNNVMYDIFESVNGAIVADPQLLDLSGLKIMGQSSLVYDHTIDLDASSEYPNLMISFNIAKNTIIFRITKITRENDEIPIGTGEQLNKMLQTRRTSIFTLCNKFLNLPNIEYFLNKLKGIKNG